MRYFKSKPVLSMVPIVLAGLISAGCNGGYGSKSAKVNFVAPKESTQYVISLADWPAVQAKLSPLVKTHHHRHIVAPRDVDTVESMLEPYMVSKSGFPAYQSIYLVEMPPSKDDNSVELKWKQFKPGDDTDVQIAE